MLNNFFDVDPRFEALAKMGNAKELWLEMKHKKEQATKLEELTYHDFFESAKRVNNNSMWVYLCEKVQQYVNNPELDKFTYREKIINKKELQSTLEVLQKDLEETFVGKKVTVTKITACGYSSYAWDVKFRIPDSDIVFELSIPDTERASLKEFEYVDYFKYGLRYEETPSYWNLLVDSYNPIEIKNYFAKKDS